MTLLKTSETIVIPGPEDAAISLSLSSRSDNSAVYKVGADSKERNYMTSLAEGGQSQRFPQNFHWYLNKREISQYQSDIN